MKKDIVNLFKEFHDTGYFAQSLNTSFMVLIAKFSGARNKDYRPISLLGSMHTLIVKVLTSHLAKVIDKIIGDSQHAFVGGR